MVRFLKLFLLFLFFIYLVIPSRGFVSQPPGSIQPHEDAFRGTPWIRTDFNNLPREEVVEYYSTQASRLNILGMEITLPVYYLYYPTEDAQRLLDLQNESTFLLEIVVPFREFYLINSYTPASQEDRIGRYRGVFYEQKTTIKYAHSDSFVRVIIFGIAVLLGWRVVKEFVLFARILAREVLGRRE